MQPNQSIRRLMWFLWVVILWAGAILVRLVSLQVVQHGELRAIAESQHYKPVAVPALRGSLLDRTGQPLAKTLVADSVAVNPQAVPDLRAAADRLGRALGLDRNQLLQKMLAYKDRGLRFMWVQRKLTPDESLRVRGLKLEGVEFRQEMRRYYPRGTLAAHVLGATGYSADSEIEHGTAGLERSFEKDLGGQAGIARASIDSRGRAYDSIVTRAPVPGADLTLSIDPNVQYEAERQLREAVAASGARSGSVVALDPYTGDVLAMANYPTYDPNSPVGRDAEAPAARSNLAISTPFEPGSVFKVITLAAALETTNLTPQSVINCGNGVLNLFGRVIHDDHKYSALSMADVLAHSSNIGAINIALAAGSEALYNYQRRFGFGEKTGIELPGESPGILWPRERWGKSSIGSLAMGHEVAVTSVQLAVAGAVIANGGLKVKPRLVLARQRAGQEKEILPVPTPERILKPETAIQMRQMMEGVVLHGTGSRAVLQGYTSGGKTGSAQIFARLHA
jgi:cell division protein FtsI (penicillin-binding protein 3)